METASKLLRECALQGSWLCLKNLHLVVAWLPQVCAVGCVCGCVIRRTAVAGGGGGGIQRPLGRATRTIGALGGGGSGITKWHFTGLLPHTLHLWLPVSLHPPAPLSKQHLQG